MRSLLVLLTLTAPPLSLAAPAASLADTRALHTIESRQSSANATAPAPAPASATVTICTEPGFQGQCAHPRWPVNQCVDLQGYAGVTKSFIPDDGFECLLMQGECDATAPYVEIGDSDRDAGGDLTKLDWLGRSNSYICFTELAQMKRFVRLAKLSAAQAKKSSA